MGSSVRHRAGVAPVVALAALIGAGLGVVVVPEAGRAAPAPARPTRVLVLGDSYSSGTGIHRDASDYDDHGPADHAFSTTTRLGDSMCLRELDTSAGARLAAELDVAASMAACAGATAADLANQLRSARVAGTGSGTLVALTLGGNDVRTRDGGGWTDVLLDCVVTPRCHDDDGNEVVDLDAVGDALVEAYVDVLDERPDLQVRVLGYPRPMQPDRWGCVGVIGIGTSEARWIDEQVDVVNDEIRRAVDVARSRTGGDLEFVPVLDEFDNHGACRIWQRDRYVNDAIWGETASRELDEDGNVREDHTDGLFTLSAASFHPSQKGYDAYARALVAHVLGDDAT